MRVNIEPFLLCVLTGFPLVIGLICLFHTFRLLKNARLLEDTPIAKIRSAAQGYVELAGTGHSLPNSINHSRLSQNPCVWYQYTIEELRTYQTNEGSTRRFETIQKGASDVYFILKDETGECLIDPTLADIIPHRTIKVYGHSPFPEIISPPSTWSWLFDTTKRYRYNESYIEPNEILYVKGYFQTLHSTHPQVKQDPELFRYLQEKNMSSLNILTHQNLVQDQHFMISAIARDKLIRRYRWTACLFFIAFLFFSTLIVNSVYPTVKKLLIDWQNQQPYEFIPPSD
jgi:hypothetical protein